LKNHFFSNQEQDLNDQFLDQGYIVIDVEDTRALDQIRELIVGEIGRQLGHTLPGGPSNILNSIADHLSVEALNDFRVEIHSRINANSTLKNNYFRTAKNALEALVGNELAMQRRINLSIQMPSDFSSLLPVHSDVWSGCSPYEIVLWVPMVDCFGTKSMYILPRAIDQKVQAKMHKNADQGAEGLFNAIKDDVVWLDVPYGKAVIFSQALMHGNIVNQEAETRWSLNCRFKNLFSPYSDKKIGEYYEPITIRAASAIGLDYELPGGFDA
jgi:sporadic carbohydrate cluster 2OG-Fe(II) oxygenase